MTKDRSGQQLDNYHLLRLLGNGTFGDVYEGTDMRRNEQVAIKVMESLKTQKDVQDFLSEVRTLVRLRHQHIIPIRDFGVDPVSGIPFIVMPYASEGSLRQRHPKGERLPLATVVQYVKQLAEALQFAHDDRSIHRDVKPDNVLFGSSGELLLSNFGVTTPSSSLFIDLNQPTLQNVAGSPIYMAPEQCRGKPEKASDQYALAIMAYEWLCGKPPFTGNNPLNIWDQHINDPVPPLHEKLSNISPKVEAVILKALAKAAKDRYPTVRVFAEALEAASKTSPIGTKLLTYRGHGDAIRSFAWSPNGKLFATGNASGLIELWDDITWQHIRMFEDCSTGSITSISWSPDGQRLASGSGDKTVQVWQASSGQLLHTYQGHTSPVQAVAWSPDGQRLASGSGSVGDPSQDKTVQVWQAV